MYDRTDIPLADLVCRDGRRRGCVGFHGVRQNVHSRGRRKPCRQPHRKQRVQNNILRHRVRCQDRAFDVFGAGDDQAVRQFAPGTRRRGNRHKAARFFHFVFRPGVIHDLPRIAAQQIDPLCRIDAASPAHRYYSAAPFRPAEGRTLVHDFAGRVRLYFVKKREFHPCLCQAVCYALHNTRLFHALVANYQRLVHAEPAQQRPCFPYLPRAIQYPGFLQQCKFHFTSAFPHK